MEGSLNPWEQESRSLKTMREALALGDMTGHYDSRRQSNDEELIREKLLDSSPSLLLITLLRSISKRKEDLQKVNKEIHCRMVDKETADFTHSAELEKKLKLLKDLSDHVQSTNSEEITLKLKQPYVSDSLKLEASYHRYASELLPLVAPVISDLHTLIDNTDWIQHKDIIGDEMRSVLSELTSCVTDVQSTIHSWCRIRDVFEQKKAII
ncbi:HAUS augmin-like complex subunit 2 [Tubulanus polymorphus]|uniref:HAUS augmin-like complex subunit 2 n=1 Tax=Tubulanus polymorphus TaxID=672921 RepID=UPI003DA51D55